MAPGMTYTPDERSKGNRLKQRTVHEQELVNSIINSTPILHVSFNAPLKEGPQFPTILPMLGALSTYSRDEEAHVYLHGSSAARLFRLSNGGEIPMCVCATILDGYVLALSPFHNSCNYRSAVVFGHGTMVSDPEEVTFALKLITNNSIPERWENSRSQPTKAELTATGVLKMRIETASAKVRAGGPHDDRADLQDADLANHTWTGVVPVYSQLGELIASEENRVKRVPEYLSDWVSDVNSMSEQSAVDAVEEPDG